jgi:beta-glucosidase-like glycosyl hydrolase/CubicO group peptidase (beta-lactamase class C family)
MKCYLTTVLIFIFVTANVMNIPLSDDSKTWAYNKMLEMSDDEKIAQLFILRANSDWDEKNLRFLESIITKHQIGGLLFFQGNMTAQANLTNRFQGGSKIPMFIAMDAEWGAGMRLKDGISFPRQMTLGAIADNELIYKMGREIGRQLIRMGVHITFSPVADINDNPDNPVIGDRSFGERKEHVASKALSYMKGLQDAGIIACAKHFPGHGNSSVDSHFELPVLNHSTQRLNDVELVPFKMLIENDVKSIMTAHLRIPALDKRKNRPASLSYPITSTLLRDSFNYRGLIITDGLDMKGVTDHFEHGDASVEAFLAGNDLLLLPANFQRAFEGMKKAVQQGKVSAQRLEASLMRILMAKFDLGLYDFQPIKTEGLLADINTNEALALKEDLYRKSMTAIGRKFALLPVLPEEYNSKIAIVSIGSTSKTGFQNRFGSYLDASFFNIPLHLTSEKAIELIRELGKFDRVVIGLHDIRGSKKNHYGISHNVVEMINQLNKRTKLCVTLFGTPYALNLFAEELCIIVAYENDEIAQDMAAQAILGVSNINGQLPVSIAEKFNAGDGFNIPNARILGYSIPENTGIDGVRLATKIDSIVDEMIKTSVTPGCQIVVAKNGKIVFERSYGHFTYDSSRTVRNDDIYDLASITKTMATTLALMKLFDENKIDLNKKISGYMDKGLRKSDKRDIRIIDAMTHYSGLVPSIPSYRLSLDTLDGQFILSKDHYRRFPDKNFSVKVADNIFLHKDYIDTMWARILNSNLNNPAGYQYSDIGLLIIGEMIEKISGTSLDKYVDKHFYTPMGLRNTAFNPLSKLSKNRIAPTEDDQYWRQQIVHGHVHDMLAAMFGGVAGHAGLFSNARDLAVLGQLMLNRGLYGNTKYFDQKTTEIFTTRLEQSTRRGIGWDMKELNSDRRLNMSEYASPSTYGHIGFTGTCIWIDPENELIFVFLSNRTYPDMKNNKLHSRNYRPRIHSAIYQSFQKSNSGS